MDWMKNKVIARTACAVLAAAMSLSLTGAYGTVSAYAASENVQTVPAQEEAASESTEETAKSKKDSKQQTTAAETEKETAKSSEETSKSAEETKKSSEETKKDTRETKENQKETTGSVDPNKDSSQPDTETTLATPTGITAVCNNGQSVTLKWDTVSGATSYLIYRGPQDGSSYTKVGESTTGTYTDKTDLTMGEKYRYGVRAVSTKTGVNASNYAEVTVSVEPDIPALVSVTSASSTSLLLTWKPVDGASGYKIYRKSASETNYRAIGTVTVSKTTNKEDHTVYTDKGLTSGVQYTYTVRSYVTVSGKNVFSSVNWTGISGSPVSAAQLRSTIHAPELISAAGYNYTSVLVRWKPASGTVNGYVVFRKVKGKKKWVKIGTVSGQDKTQYADKTARFGVKYIYTVNSYISYDGKTVGVLAKDYDKLGKQASANLAAPKLKSAAATGTTSIKVTWKKVAGAQGYYVYRKTANSGWKTVGRTTSTSFTDKKTSGGQTFTYTVRAYRKYKGHTYRGLYNKKGIQASVKITSRYKNGLKLYYTASGKLITDTTSIIGKQSSYYIEVDKSRNIVTVYAKDENGKYCVPVKAFVCSTGNATPLGTFRTPQKYRWHVLDGGVYGQWCTRIHGGVLFHSVYYYSQSPYNLAVKEYNKLGTTASHGCVRLTAGDAKWIYDNCKLGTTVHITTSGKNPFGKPSAYHLKTSHKWDPTDPYAYARCKKLGCH